MHEAAPGLYFYNRREGEGSQVEERGKKKSTKKKLLMADGANSGATCGDFAHRQWLLQVSKGNYDNGH